MLTGSIPKLLQEARAIQQALEQMGENVPAGISAAEMASRTDALENVVNQINMVNAEKTRLVDSQNRYSAERKRLYRASAFHNQGGFRGRLLRIRHGRRHKKERAEEAEEKG
jgi:hypothetical protein